MLALWEGGPPEGLVFGGEGGGVFNFLPGSTPEKLDRARLLGAMQAGLAVVFTIPIVRLQRE